MPELPKSPELPKLQESEERYAYYRRCQVFRKNGQQCKAPAVKGEELCHKHQDQLDAGRGANGLRYRRWLI